MRLSLLLIVLLSAPCDQLQTNEWRGLQPLRSARADVEREIGDPLEPGVPSYKTKEESVEVVYATSPCDPTIAGNWDVPTDTVIRITVTPKPDVYLKSLHLDETQYRRVEDPHISGLVSYVSEDSGVIIQSRYDKVIAVIYGPASGDKHLMCQSKD